MQPVQSIDVCDRFPPLYDALLAVLTSLDDGQWDSATVCPGWSVKDVVLHLLGGDIGILSRGRDGYRPAGPTINSWDGLVAFINELNATWITATRRMSPRVVCDLMRFTAPQVSAYFASCDLFAIGNPVSWAGPDPAPVWLDVAREYTERWHHQQQIREAVGAPGLTDPYYLAPAFDAFVRSLPWSYRDVQAPEGTAVVLTITGAAGQTWCLQREGPQWQLYVGQPNNVMSEMIVPQDIAWRVFTKGMTTKDAYGHVIVRGNPELGNRILETLAVIA